jgi:RNA polymerase sigma-70 factor (ECF subfamily)
VAQSSKNPISDEVLVRATKGDERAIAVIWTAWNPPLLRFFRGRNAVEPDDLAQQVWLEVAKKLPAFKGDRDAFRRWIFTLAHRRLIDAARVRLRRPPTVERVDTAVDDGTSQVDELDWALSLLRQLPDQQATAVSLRILAGMSVPDVAAVMGKRPGAIRALTHRGLRRLEELIDRQENPGVTVTAAPVLSLTSDT